MKAVVVEIKNNYAAVLSDNGCISKVKNKNYVIGQVIYIRSEKSFSKKMVTIAASAAALFVLGTGTWAYAAPYSYVSLDVNPSIEFTVNRFDRVIRVKAVNDDGEELLKNINLNDLKNETIKNALSTTIEKITVAGYFEDDIEAGLIIATSAKSSEKAEKLVMELQETVDSELVEQGKEVEVEAISIGYERVQEAKKLGVTPGKLNLVEKLQASAEDPESIVIEEWLSKPVKEIMKATKENRKGAKTLKEEIITDSQKEKSEIEKAKEKATGKETSESRKASISARKEEKEAEKAARKEQKEAQKAAKKAQKEEEKALRKAQKEDASLIQKEKSEKVTDKNDKKAKQDEKKSEKTEEKEHKKSEQLSQKGKDKGEKSSDKSKKAEEKVDKKAFQKSIENEDRKDTKQPENANKNKSNKDNSNSKNYNKSKSFK